MLTCCYSAKGGNGTTTATVALALARRARPGGVLLVDLGGDVHAALGLAEPTGPGVTEWADAGGDVAAGALDRLATAVDDGLAVIGRGHGRGDGPACLAVVEALVTESARRTVVIDAATVTTPLAALARRRATERFLVTRPCYLSLRRTVGPALARPTAVLLVAEPGRSLRRRDVEAAAGAPVAVEIPVDAGIARAVDAGLLATGLPRRLGRSLAALR